MLAERPWKLDSLLRLAMFVFVSIGGTVILGMVAVFPIARALGLSATLVAQLISFFAIQGLALVWITVFLKEHNLTWSSAFGLANSPRASLLIAAITMVVAWPAAILLGNLMQTILTIFGVNAELQLPVEFIKNKPPTWQLFITGFTAVVLAPVAEETLFRGILFTSLRQFGYGRGAWWGNALLFGVIHFNLMAFVPMVMLGLVWTWLYQRTGNLLAPILGHVIFNATSFTFLVVEPPKLLERFFGQ